MMQVWWVYHF